MICSLIHAQTCEDYLHSFGKTDLWKYHHVVAKRCESHQQPFILRDGFLKIVLAIGIIDVNLWPRRHEKYPLVVALLADCVEDRSPRNMFQCRSRIDQSAIKEDQAGNVLGPRQILELHFDRPHCECGRIDPWERRPIAPSFFSDDPPAGLFDNGMAAQL